MNRADRSMLRFTQWVTIKLLWLFWILVLLSAATCVAVLFKSRGIL